MGAWDFERNYGYEKIVEKLAKLNLLEKCTSNPYPNSYLIKNEEAFRNWGLALFVMRAAYMYWSQDNQKKEDENRDLLLRTKSSIPFSIVPLNDDSVLLLLGIAPPENADYIMPQKYYNENDCVPGLLHNLCFSDIKEGIPLFDGSQRSRKKIWQWFKEKIRKNEEYIELLGFSSSMIINVPASLLEMLIKEVEDISSSVSSFLDIFFTCYAATKLRPLVHIANTKLMGNPFYSNELDGALFEKDTKDLIIIETTAGHDKERLNTKVLSALAFNSCDDLKNFFYLYLTFIPISLDDRQYGTLKQALEYDFFRIIEPDPPLPKNTEVKELLRKDKGDEIKQCLTDSFNSLISQFGKELDDIKNRL